MASAAKLLDRMRGTKSGWRPIDLDRLYKGFGFQREEAKEHTHYYHLSHPDLRGTVGRHRELAPFVVAQAVQAIEKLLEREHEFAPEEIEEDTDAEE
jgi:hypothetical protein